MVKNKKPCKANKYKALHGFYFTSKKVSIKLKEGESENNFGANV
jgi:hypothetical protein